MSHASLSLRTGLEGTAADKQRHVVWDQDSVLHNLHPDGAAARWTGKPTGLNSRRFVLVPLARSLAV